MIEGYGYKIVFSDGSWYWGTSQYKGLPPEKDGYYGSPVTHKAKWNDPHSKIVLKVFYDEQTRLDYEEICIASDLNNPKCLNEHNGRGFSREACRKGGKAAADKSRGVPRTDEVKEKIAEKHKGKKLLPEHIQKLKDAERPPRTLEAIAKSVENRKGYRHTEDTKRKIRKGNTGKTRSQEVKNRISETVKGFKWYNNGKESIQARFNPGGEWIEGRISNWDSPRNSGMKWYHRNGERRMFYEDPGDGWILGRPRSKGKRYYNNGSQHVLAFECPGTEWVLGRLKRK
jgi:hypothetical protein